MDLEQQMAARVRRHMITSFSGLLAAIALMVIAGAAARALFGDAPPSWVRVLPVLGILLIPAIGFYSTFKNLRCPSCNHLVAFQVSANYSLFGAKANKACNGCGHKIFGDLIAQRVRRMFMVMFAIGIGLGVVSAILSAVLHH